MVKRDWKAFYLKSGKYDDGRERIVIAWYDKVGLRKIKALPKPEDLRDILIKLSDGDGKALFNKGKE